MPFRSVTADRRELQRLCEAFDDAWVAVSSARLIENDHIPAERERLGYILVQIWEGDREAHLATRAVQLFLNGVRKNATPASAGRQLDTDD